MSNALIPTQSVTPIESANQGILVFFLYIYIYFSQGRPCVTCAFLCATSGLLVRPKSGRPGPGGPQVQDGTVGRPSNIGC